MKFTVTFILALATTVFALPAPEEAASTSKTVAKTTGKLTSSIMHTATTTKVVTTTKPTIKTSASGVASSCIHSTYNPAITGAPTFTNLTCTLSKALTPGQPLSCLFPTAAKIGKILGPFLSDAIGNKSLTAIDKVAEDLCISADQDPADGPGLCDNTLQLVRDLAASQDQSAVDKYNCLLNLLCVAHTSPKNKGTCQYLLAGADCIANRILKVPGSPECEGKSV